MVINKIRKILLPIECGHFGLPVCIGEDRNIRIMPELTLLVPLFSNYRYGDETEFFAGLDAFVITFGIGVANVSDLLIKK